LYLRQFHAFDTQEQLWNDETANVMPTIIPVVPALNSKRNTLGGLHVWANRWVVLLARMKSRIYYHHIFHSFGARSYLMKPILINNPQFISIGQRVSIRQGLRLEALPYHARIPFLSIGDDVNIEQNVHLVCHSRLIIGNRVTITGNCAIVDTTHPHEDIRDPRRIGDRILDDDSYVEIGEGSFLGFGSVVLPNVRIGRHCVIGANSTVTTDIPDYCVAAGTPAIVVSRYDTGLRCWVKVKTNQVILEHASQLPLA
jgi:acetyltransferase-like isoleucine patch superfamily enzyme